MQPTQYTQPYLRPNYFQLLNENNGAADKAKYTLLKKQNQLSLELAKALGKSQPTNPLSKKTKNRGEWKWSPVTVDIVTTGY